MTRPAGRALPGNRWDLLDGVVPTVAPMVSVVVAHFRQPEQLARTLHALARQDHPSDRLEVIVADDGSPERPVVPDGIRLVRQEDAGFRLAAVRNLGAAAAKGDILVFLDADTAPEPAFVRELVRLPALAPDCVTVGARRHADLAGAPTDSAIERAVAGRGLPEPAWLRDAYRTSRDLLDADDRSYRHVVGAVLACSRTLFDEVGGFDESFTAYGGEDWEWVYRAWNHGAVLAHVRAAIAWHDGPDAAGRPTDSAVKNEEAIRLADLIPVPGSRAHGHRSAKVDIEVVGPPAASAGQRFISLDSVLAALPGAESRAADGSDRDRFDRVRLRVELLRPVRIAGAGIASLTDALARVTRDGMGDLELVDDHERAVLRIVSMRAMARGARWNRRDLFPSGRALLTGSIEVPVDPDVEAYLGGWR